MIRQHFSIGIRAPKKKVWETMLGADTYREWTEVFGPGSHFVGNWTEGSRILFLAPGEHGESGMVSRIRESRPYDFISIEHLGVVRNGVEDMSGDEVMPWKGALENYTFTATGNETVVAVDTDTAEEYAGMFQEVWPKALARLKDLAEE